MENRTPHFAGGQESLLIRRPYGLFKIGLCSPEHADVVVSGDIAVKQVSDTLCMAHLSEYAAVRRGDALYGADGSVGIIADIHGGISLQVCVLGGDLSVFRKLTDQLLGGQETALSMGDGNVIYLTRLCVDEPGGLVGGDPGADDLGLVSGNGIDAIQLGAGTNNQTKTLQVYSDNIYDAASHTLNVNNANITTADITTLTNTTINNHGTINTTGLYTINGVQTGRNRTFIGTYTGGDGVTVPIGSLAAYSYFEIVFNGVSSRKISTGLISCADKTYFSVYYPNVGGIRGYKASDTSLRIEDTDGTTSFSVYGIN